MIHIIYTLSVKVSRTARERGGATKLRHVTHRSLQHSQKEAKIPEGGWVARVGPYTNNTQNYLIHI